MAHSIVRWPQGQPPTPFGCRWCGIAGPHGWQYLPKRGYHQWEQPTERQILARMKARREARKSVCRCPEPWEAAKPFAPVVDPWRCEADHCRMHDHLIGLWLRPLSADDAMRLVGGNA
ncbi:hypothetical protein ACFYOF_16575 [Streptomyces sp. NPDC007148]|uniref:hypothetical protein n=1 Tax=Streptomyces sp. NPDC007148 TaxID=3364775 RepID=UPI0036755C5F